MRFLCAASACLGLSVLFTTSSFAQVINYVEADAPGGMFSTNNLNPTSIPTFGIGDNTVSGTVVAARSVVNTQTDVYTITIPTGAQLNSMLVTSYSGGNPPSFVGFNFGDTFPHDADGLDDVDNDSGGGNPNQIFPYLANGGTTFQSNAPFGSPDPILFNQDFNPMDQVSVALNGPGFGPNPTDPLVPGPYTIYVQETSNSASASYEFTFNVSESSIIPEPSSFAALGFVGAIATMRRRRRS